MKVLIKPRRCYRPMGLAIKSKTISNDTLKDVIGKIKDVEHQYFVLYFENLFLLSYETGSRISEITPIHETDLDLRYGVVHYVVRKKRKKPMETSKFLTPELLERLREHVKQYKFQIDQSGGYIFFGMSSKTKHITVRTAERHFEMARDVAGHGSIYGESRPIYKITNITNKPQQLNLYGKITENGKEVDIITKRITILPGESTNRSIDPKKYEKEKNFQVEHAYSKKLRRCTIHSIRHLSLQTVLEEKGLFEAFDHADHVSITSTMAYLDANPKKRMTRAAVFRNFYPGGNEENNNSENKTPKAVSATVEETTPPNYGQMADLFTQMAQMLDNMGQNNKQDKSEKLSEEFDAVMRMKAEEEHVKAYAQKRQAPQHDTSEPLS